MLAREYKIYLYVRKYRAKNPMSFYPATRQAQSESYPGKSGSQRQCDGMHLSSTHFVTQSYKVIIGEQSLGTMYKYLRGIDLRRASHLTQCSSAGLLPEIHCNSSTMIRDWAMNQNEEKPYDLAGRRERGLGWASRRHWISCSRAKIYSCPGVTSHSTPPRYDKSVAI
jgi:hypothetical protein